MTEQVISAIAEESHQQAGMPPPPEEQTTQAELPEPESEELPGPEAEELEISVREEIAALRAQVAALNQALAAKAGGEQVEEMRVVVEGVQVAALEGVQEGQRQQEALRAEAQAAVDRLAERLNNVDQTLAEAMALFRPRVRAEVFDPTTVPPDVLRGAYEQTTTNVYGHMLQTLGPDAERRVRAIMERIRRITAGMEFFHVTEDGRIVAPGLAEALHRRLISPHQIHITFDHFLRNLLEEVPGYRPPPLRDLVDTGTRAYTVNTVTQLLEENQTIRTELGRSAARLESLERFASDEAQARGEALASLEREMTSALETATGELGARVAGLEATLSALAQRLAALEQHPESFDIAQDKLVEEGEVRQTLTVTRSGTIGLGGARYYVARKLAGEEVQVEVGEAEVRIYHQGELIKTHLTKK